MTQPSVDFPVMQTLPAYEFPSFTTAGEVMLSRSGVTQSSAPMYIPKPPWNLPSSSSALLSARGSETQHSAISTPEPVAPDRPRPVIRGQGSSEDRRASGPKGPSMTPYSSSPAARPTPHPRSSSPGNYYKELLHPMPLDEENPANFDNLQPRMVQHSSPKLSTSNRYSNNWVDSTPTHNMRDDAQVEAIEQLDLYAPPVQRETRQRRPAVMTSVPDVAQDTTASSRRVQDNVATLEPSFQARTSARPPPLSKGAQLGSRVKPSGGTAGKSTYSDSPRLYQSGADLNQHRGHMFAKSAPLPVDGESISSVGDHHQQRPLPSAEDEDDPEPFEADEKVRSSQRSWGAGNPVHRAAAANGDHKRSPITFRPTQTRKATQVGAAVYAPPVYPGDSESDSDNFRPATPKKAQRKKSTVHTEGPPPTIRHAAAKKKVPVSTAPQETTEEDPPRIPNDTNMDAPAYRHGWATVNDFEPTNSTLQFNDHINPPYKPPTVVRRPPERKHSPMKGQKVFSNTQAPVALMGPPPSRVNKGKGVARPTPRQTRQSSSTQWIAGAKEPGGDFD